MADFKTLVEPVKATVRELHTVEFFHRNYLSFIRSRNFTLYVTRMSITVFTGHSHWDLVVS